jgi:hypothetical protein
MPWLASGLKGYDTYVKARKITEIAIKNQLS